MFTSGLGEVTWSKDGSSLLKPVFLKIDEGYHAARECAAFFTIETKRSGKLPSSARAERHNLFCRGKVILRFRQNFCAIISCKRTKFSSTDLYWKNSSLLGNDVIHVHVKVKHFILPYRQLINILLLSALNTFVSCIELTNLNYHYFRIDRNNAIGYMSDIHLSDSPTNILSKMLLILKKNYLI